MRAPYSRIPALPAAIGLAAGIAVAGAGAAVLFSVAAGAVSAVVLWAWRPGRFFASAAAAFCFGILLGDVADKPVAVRYPDARAPLAMWLTRPMLLGRSGRRLRVVVVLCAVWGFAWLGGMSAQGKTRSTRRKKSTR